MNMVTVSSAVSFICQFPKFVLFFGPQVLQFCVSATHFSYSDVCVRCVKCYSKIEHEACVNVVVDNVQRTDDILQNVHFLLLFCSVL